MYCIFCCMDNFYNIHYNMLNQTLRLGSRFRVHERCSYWSKQNQSDKYVHVIFISFKLYILLDKYYDSVRMRIRIRSYK